MGKDTRTYSGHWDSYIYGPEHPKPPSRWSWVRDAAIGSVGALFLGYSIGLRLATGEWATLATTVGLACLAVLAFTLTLGQFVESTHQTKSDLLRVGSTTAIVLVVALAVTALANL